MGIFSENQRLLGQFQNEKKHLVSAGNLNLVQFVQIFLRVYCIRKISKRKEVNTSSACVKKKCRETKT
jgi:hypothetical protein